jgi:hypothetical protein
MTNIDLKPIADQAIDAASAMKTFLDTVHKMRLAQKRYFELMARAKKSKVPDEFTTARNVLTMSKELERQVDEQIEQLTAKPAAV